MLCADENFFPWIDICAIQINKIIIINYSGIGAIKRIRHLVPQATLQLIYQPLIQPHFDYCNIVWGNCGITLRNKVQKLQNREARVLTY